MALRSLCFRDGIASDQDAFDDRCHHVVVEDRSDSALGGCFRLTVLPSLRIGSSYAAQFYDLARLSTHQGPIAEFGRFCLHPDHRDPDILRMALGALAALVDRSGVRMLIGCTSFRGISADAHADAFAVLRARHLAPDSWAPGRKSDETFGFPATPADSIAGLRAMPPLLRSYLAMGARVGDHAVVDRDLGTLHVFTGLDVSAIPPGRVRTLRSLAAVLPR